MFPGSRLVMSMCTIFVCYYGVFFVTKLLRLKLLANRPNLYLIIIVNDYYIRNDDKININCCYRAVTD